MKSVRSADTKQLNTDNENDLKVDSEFDCSDSYNDFSIDSDLIFLLKFYQTILDNEKILENWDEIDDHINLESDLNHHLEISEIKNSWLLDSIFDKYDEMNLKFKFNFSLMHAQSVAELLTIILSTSSILC